MFLTLQPFATEDLRSHVLRSLHDLASFNGPLMGRHKPWSQEGQSIKNVSFLRDVESSDATIPNPKSYILCPAL